MYFFYIFALMHIILLLKEIYKNIQKSLIITEQKFESIFMITNEKYQIFI